MRVLFLATTLVVAAVPSYAEASWLSEFLRGRCHDRGYSNAYYGPPRGAYYAQPPAYYGPPAGYGYGPSSSDCYHERSYRIAPPCDYERSYGYYGHRHHHH